MTNSTSQLKVKRVNGRLMVHHSLLNISQIRKLSDKQLDALVARGNNLACNVVLERFVD